MASKATECTLRSPRLAVKGSIDFGLVVTLWVDRRSSASLALAAVAAVETVVGTWQLGPSPCSETQPEVDSASAKAAAERRWPAAVVD